MRSSISKDLKSYLCNYGLKIRDIVTKVELKDELRKLKGCYVIKHKMLPEKFKDAEEAKGFRECTIELFCKFFKEESEKSESKNAGTENKENNEVQE